MFLEALVDPLGLPRWRFAGGTLALRMLGILLFWTSIHGSSERSSGLSTAAVTIGSSDWGPTLGLVRRSAWVLAESWTLGVCIGPELD